MAAALGGDSERRWPAFFAQLLDIGIAALTGADAADALTDIGIADIDIRVWTGKLGAVRFSSAKDGANAADVSADAANSGGAARKADADAPNAGALPVRRACRSDWL